MSNTKADDLLLRGDKLVKSVPVQEFGEVSVDDCAEETPTRVGVRRVNLASTDGCGAMEIATARRSDRRGTHGTLMGRMWSLWTHG